MNEKNIFVISVAFAAIMGCTSYSSRLQTDDVAEINAVIKEIKAGSDYGAFDKLLNDPSVSDVAKARILIVQGPDTVAREVFSHGQFPGVASPWLTQGVMDALYMQTTDRMKEGILNSGTLANQNATGKKSIVFRSRRNWRSARRSIRRFRDGSAMSAALQSMKISRRTRGAMSSSWKSRFAAPSAWCQTVPAEMRSSSDRRQSDVGYQR